jgi:hypothetical protein
MTTIDSTAALPVAELVDDVRPVSRWSTAEAALERAGEYLNPILVKECRQALKSRQFVITFALVLLFAWGWSILGVAMSGPEIYYSFAGADLFFGYYIILAFPLMIIVPYCAFRSLAGEREDRTFELLSITTLKPRQIVGGKLGSAVVQMVVYFSAISPCLAFTYMLRGIDVLTIVFILLYSFMASLGLSLLSLLLATLTSEKHWQIVMSVALVLGLAAAFITAWMICYQILSWNNMSFDEAAFWVANAALLTAYVSYAALVYLTAAAQLTFASDNRSTPLRVVMLVQFLLFTGWMSGLFAGLSQQNQIILNELGGFLVAYLCVCGVHWYIMGTFLVGEWPHLSPRVKRRLPQSFLGRAFLTWFNPGPGTGYLFAVGNLFVAGLLSMIMLFVATSISPNAITRTPSPEQVTFFTLIGFSYITIYLGIGKLAVAGLTRIAPVGVVLSVLLQILLVLAGAGIPLVIHLMSDYRSTGWNLLHITNPIWTLAEVADSGTGLLNSPTLLLILAPLALIVFVANLPSVAAEVRHVRIAAPKRVAEEDAEAAALAAPPQPVRSSPWDEDDLPAAT